MSRRRPQYRVDWPWPEDRVVVVKIRPVDLARAERKRRAMRTVRRRAAHHFSPLEKYIVRQLNGYFFAQVEAELTRLIVGDGTGELRGIDPDFEVDE